MTSIDYASGGEHEFSESKGINFDHDYKFSTILTNYRTHNKGSRAKYFILRK